MSREHGRGRCGASEPAGTAPPGGLRLSVYRAGRRGESAGRPKNAAGRSGSSGVQASSARGVGQASALAREIAASSSNVHMRTAAAMLMPPMHCTRPQICNYGVTTV